MNENDVFLVAVVEVEYDKRILCQAPGCGRSVYRKIHIVLESTEFTLLGYDCYRRIYGSDAVREPFYSWGSDRRLTDEERQQLIENTAAFIEQLEQELVSSSLERGQSATASPAFSPKSEPVYMPSQPAGRRGIAQSSLMRVQFLLQSFADDDEYSGHKMLAWRWAGSLDEVFQTASSWKQRTVLDSDHDLALRTFVNTPPATPYDYALAVESACRLPKFRTLRVLHELGLATR